MTQDHDLDQILLTTFGKEWDALTEEQQDAIRYDCKGGKGDRPVTDFATYRKNIGKGNLRLYADVQIIRRKRDGDR